MQTISSRIRTLEWVGAADGHLRLIDQTRLPREVTHVDCRDIETLHEAIRSLRVRGAPAIGVAAAYGVCLGIQSARGGDEAALYEQIAKTNRYLATSRPTAVNLFWALDRMEQKAAGYRGKASPLGIAQRLLDEAHEIHREDDAMCRSIGRHGAELLSDGQGVLTHCNAGGLATSGYGTALALFYAAAEAGKRLHVYADETRPLLQGARLTTWELMQHDIPVTLICDSMAAQVMREGRVQAVVVGADRIAANGDTANKIGTYGLALLAAAHDVPFYVAAPSSTFDLTLPTGDWIPIENRSAQEVVHGFGARTAPEGVNVYNPAFDVTPARLIQAIICEHGIITPVDGSSVAQTLPAA